MNYALSTISSIHILFSMEKFEDFSSVTPPLAYHHVIYDLSFFRVKKMLMFKLKYFGYFSFDFNCNFFTRMCIFFSSKSPKFDENINSWDKLWQCELLPSHLFKIQFSKAVRNIY